MKGIWATSSVLWLGVAFGAARADEHPWRPPVTLGRPVAVAPAADRPADVRPGAVIQPTAFHSAVDGGSAAVARAKGPEGQAFVPPLPPLPMPAGEPAQKGPPLTEVLNPDPKLGQPTAAMPNGMPGEPALAGAPLEGGFAADPWCGAPGCCGEGGCVPPDCLCTGGGVAPRFWGKAELLLWNVSNSHFPPLVTTSPPTSLGVLGAPGTAVLFGGSVSQEEFTGGRFTAGWWLDPCERCGLEATYFFLGRRSMGYDAASTGTPLLARPFFNANPAVNGEDSELIANPAIPAIPALIPLTGAIHIRQSTELWGTEGNAVWNCCRGCWGRLDFLAGFRYLQLKEDLNITENLMVPFTSPTVPGEMIFVNDHFGTRNQFYGGQIGARAEWNWRRWTLEATTKVALGTTHQQVDITGATIITPFGGPPAAFTGGLLAQPTNIGHFSRDHFTVIPEVGLNVGYNLNDHWRIYTGYNFIYWNTVVRPGDQIDRVVNSSQLPGHTGPFVGPARPAFGFHETAFWAHGVNFGVEFKY